MAIFVNIAGAFDNLWWPALFRQLREMECPAAIYNMLRNYCTDRYVVLRCPGESVAKHITKGADKAQYVDQSFGTS